MELTKFNSLWHAEGNSSTNVTEGSVDVLGRSVDEAYDEAEVAQSASVDDHEWLGFIVITLYVVYIVNSMIRLFGVVRRQLLSAM